MSQYTTRPIKELTTREFRDLIAGLAIVVSPHALDHLSNQQRDLFEDKQLSEPLKKESPRKVFLQMNQRYCLYFRRKEGYQKMIVAVEPKRVNIISYMNVPEIPKVKLEDEE